jgi:hypothetical protein
LQQEFQLVFQKMEDLMRKYADASPHLVDFAHKVRQGMDKLLQDLLMELEKLAELEEGQAAREEERLRRQLQDVHKMMLKFQKAMGGLIMTSIRGDGANRPRRQGEVRV